MRHPAIAAVLLLSTTVVACGASTSTSPAAPGSTTSVNLTGNWIGTAADSSGDTMGVYNGASPAPGSGPGMGMGLMSPDTMKWQITQSDNTFTGTASMASYQGSQMIALSGTLNGKSGTFMMTMPDGSMPMAGCTGTAAGTFEMDDSTSVMHGTYAGATSCAGPFANGQIAMVKQ